MQVKGDGGGNRDENGDCKSSCRCCFCLDGSGDGGGDEYGDGDCHCCYLGCLVDGIIVIVVVIIFVVSSEMEVQMEIDGDDDGDLNVK